MYIQYTMDQLFLPMDLEEDIPQNHIVRLVNAAINRLYNAILTQLIPFEVGWLSLAHHLLKQAANDQKHRAAILQ